ncbi:hypothetical protein ASPBRDRAFT_167552 [Aspergillus brasiliensis CBS 101740]|uniref:Uncharacterized protein n=1 Tax=Aspergillus brasiliensis (strain CBS 101740 / IMI 381727 / IBT 21946) TaxID=767769 RepID=A0A1L9V2E9_ASPBC|nr:hypothetical protein ASPBRDRAFT_167552 [Aspergillus brasiliensis CBS 101740]
MAGSKAVALLFLLVNLTTASVIPRGEASSSGVAASASASAEASCWRYTLPTTLTEDDIEQNEDDSTSSTRRRGLNYFDRRDHGKVTKLGECSLGQTIYKPQYFRSKNIQSGQTKASGYSFLGYFIPKLDSCDAAVTYTTIADAADVSKTTAGYWDDVAAGSLQNYLDLGVQINKNNQDKPHINVDHVYELQILDAFLAAIIDEYNFCDDFKTWFLTIDSTFKNKQGVNKPRLQKLYSYLPGETYPELVAMDSRLNSYKAPMFGTTALSGMAAVEGTGDARQDSALSIMNTLAVVVSMLRDNSVATYFKDTNTRMFKAFLGIDDLMNQDTCNSNLPKPKDGWATAYKSWMNKFMTDQANAVSTRISSVSAQVTSTEAAGVKNSYGKALDAFNEKYPTASWKWDTNQLLDWSATDGTAFAKRDSSSVAACTPTATPSSSAVKSHSASSKATPSQTGSASTASETASHTVKSTVTSSSQKATITPATSTPTKAETTSKSKNSSGSAEAAQTTKSTSSKPKDTDTATTTSSSSSAKDTATITSTKTTSTATPDSETSTKTTSTKDTSTKDTTTTTSTSTTTSETTTSTTTSTKTKSTKTATKTTTKSSEETKDSSSSSSSCKKKKCKKGKCTCVS